MFWVYPRLKKWDMGITINGFLGGLVAITVSVLLGQRHRRGHHRCRSPGSSSCSASTSSSSSASTTRSVPSPSTAVAGIWGTWSLGLFATGQFGDVRRACSGAAARKQLFAQIWGNAVIGGAAFVVAFVV